MALRAMAKAYKACSRAPEMPVSMCMPSNLTSPHPWVATKHSQAQHCAAGGSGFIFRKSLFLNIALSYDHSNKGSALVKKPIKARTTLLWIG